MGVNDVGDSHTSSLGLFQKPVLIARDHVDGDRLTMAGAAEEVGKRGIGYRALLEEHGGLLF